MDTKIVRLKDISEKSEKGRNNSERERGKSETRGKGSEKREKWEGEKGKDKKGIKQKVGKKE